MSIHHAFRNLVDLTVSPGAARRCSAARRPASACSSTTRARPRLGLQLWPGGAPAPGGDSFDIAPSRAPCISSPSRPVSAAGCSSPPAPGNPPPLGLIRAWSLFQPDQRCLVYPRRPSMPHPAPRRRRPPRQHRPRTRPRRLRRAAPSPDERLAPPRRLEERRPRRPGAPRSSMAAAASGLAGLATCRPARASKPASRSSPAGSSMPTPPASNTACACRASSSPPATAAPTATPASPPSPFFGLPTAHAQPAS